MKDVKTKEKSKRRVKKRTGTTRIFIKILIFAVPIIVVSFLFFKLYQASAYEATYTIDLNPQSFRDESLPLYINENLSEEKFGEGGIVNNEHYFEIIGPLFEFVWQPEEFPINKDITISAIIKGNIFLELGIPCRKCGEEKYKWETFYDPLGSASVIAAAFEKIVTIDYKKNSSTEIKNELVGSQVFYVYLENKLDLSITKKSFNPFGIEKNITVELADLKGKIVWEEKIPYVTDKETSFRFETNLEEKGIYKLSITNPQDDFVIINLSINTNKITIADDIIAELNFSENKNKWVAAEKYIDQDIGDKKAIHFILRNPSLEEKKRKEDSLTQRGFSIAQEFSTEGGDFLIWKRDDAPALGFVVPSTESTLQEFLTLSVPEGGIIEENEDLGIMSMPPEGFSSEKTTISTDLRGNHSFYLYLSDSLKSDITIKELNWYEGADDVTITLSRKNADILCQRTIADDGNTSADKKEQAVSVSFECNNLTPGTYLLSFKESSSKKDYVIKELSVNTNKIVVKGGVLNLNSIPLYINVAHEKDIKFYYWHDNLDQEILFRSGEKELTLTLSKEDKGLGVFYTLPAGLWEINASKGNLVISNADFSFSSTHWFAVEPDYVVTESRSSDIITLKNITVTVE